MIGKLTEKLSPPKDVVFFLYSNFLFYLLTSVVIICMTAVNGKQIFLIK